MRLIDADALKNDFDVQYFVNNERVFDIPQIKAFVDIAPTVEANPEWIPVTELDLDHNQEALIKLDDGFICSAKFLISDSGNNCGFYHKHIGFLQCPQVVAWMPYNSERGGKK